MKLRPMTNDRLLQSRPPQFMLNPLTQNMRRKCRKTLHGRLGHDFTPPQSPDVGSNQDVELRNSNMWVISSKMVQLNEVFLPS